MSDKPITEQEYFQVISDLDMLITALKTHQATHLMADFNELPDHHGAWLDLYQIGQQISYLAEKLDSTYQAQFADGNEVINEYPE